MSNVTESVVLGLHKDPWHDTGAAVIASDAHGRRRIAHANEERFNREKASRAFPSQSTTACLRECGLDSPLQADLVAVDWSMDDGGWDKDFRRNRCRTDVFLRDIRPERLVQVRHHLCHAAASFFTSPFHEAAILVVDGRGSNYETQTLWRGTGCGIELVAETRVVGIGLLYEAITRWIGFGPLEAGKTMGLAPFGSRLQAAKVDLSGRFDGIATDYGHLCGRDDEILFAADRPVTFEDRARYAFAAQMECERAMAHLARWVRSETGTDKLCLGGGVALNGVANYKLRQLGLFSDIYVNPACSDSGIAFGAALWGFHGILGQPRTMEFVSPYTGPTYAREDVDAALGELSGLSRAPTVTKQGADERAVSLLANGRCVALFQGRSEMGPRALGNRSILMAPFEAASRDRLNHVVKRREPFRPFAPVVREEDARTYFELAGSSPFMLNVCPVKPAWRDRLQAITHVDGTARPQTLDAQQNPRLRTLLERFGALTGVPVLLNTSFNVAGEPLVESPADAVRGFMNSELDALLLEDVLIEK